jgi:hypothetical protein
LKVMRDGRPVTVEVTADGAGLVSHAGTALLGQAANTLGLTSALSARLAGLKQRRRGHDPGRVFLDLAVMLADGGECVSYLGAIREQDALFGDVASVRGRSRQGAARPDGVRNWPRPPAPAPFNDARASSGAQRPRARPMDASSPRRSRECDPSRWGRLRRSRDPLQALERALAGNVDNRAIAEARQDFDQMLRVLIRARARSIRRIQVVLVVTRRGQRRLAPRRPER